MAGAERATVGAGPLRELWAFDKRTVVDDGAGNTTGEWQQQFKCAARRESLKGTEAVMGARLENRQPYLATIRCTPTSVRVTHEWRARDLRTGAVYGISSLATRPRRDYIDFIATEGPAEG